MSSILREAREIYHASRKPSDIFWNLWVARPLAAALLVVLRRTPLTPNQASFVGLGIFVLAVAALLLDTGSLGFVVAAALLQLSYVFDCADGQLARLKGMTSAVGAYLDFLIDEFKALLLVAGCALRLWLEHGDDPQRALWLFVGLGGVMLVAVATSLTTFVRRPAYAGEEIKPGTEGAGASAPSGLVARILWLVKRVLRWIVHYPSWFTYLILIDLLTPIDGALAFLVPFLGVYLLYTAQVGLGVFLRLASPGFYRG